jgi:regulator of protease activity HflC (stomatin/prohibitin superfamily)
MSLNDVLQLLIKILGAVWQIIFQYAQKHPWTVAVALYGLALTFGVMIRSGQRGVLFRWGRVVKELEPGFHWLLPLVHGVKKTPVRSVTLVLPAQKVMTADGLVYDVSVNFVYRVEDATKALTLVDHLDSGCRAAIPIIVTEVLRVRDQAQLVDRASLDRELFERMHAWVARWGLVVEQAGFTTIAPDKSVLQTTQLRSKTMERARALQLLIAGGLDPEFALVMIGSERRPVAKSSRRYHLRPRQAGWTTNARRRKKITPKSPEVAKTTEKGT